MIILGWIGFVLLFILFVTMLGKSSRESFRVAFVNCCVAFAWMVTIIVSCVGLAWLLLILMYCTFNKSSEPDTSTVLSCNNVVVVVVESTNGFSYHTKSGTYRDNVNGLTYTPRQGEVCKEYLKGSE